MNPEKYEPTPVKPIIDDRSPAEKGRAERAAARKALDVAKAAKAKAKKSSPKAKAKVRGDDAAIAKNGHKKLPSKSSKKSASSSRATSVHSKSTKTVQPRNPSNITPTIEIAGEMQAAFDHFNATLFQGGELPQCVLTLVRLKKAAGHFWPKQWARDRAKAGGFHEIGLDPIVLRDRTDKEGLSTVAHEMVHLLLEVNGEGPKRSYHCKKWAAAMKAIGLQPYAIVKGERSDKETGANCAHDIVKGGEFDKAADALLDKGFQFSWSALPVPKPEPKAKKKKAGVKVKYTCGCCDTSFWGKGGIKATCQDGGEDFVQEGSDGDAEAE